MTVQLWDVDVTQNFIETQSYDNYIVILHLKMTLKTEQTRTLTPTIKPLHALCSGSTLRTGNKVAHVCPLMLMQAKFNPIVCLFKALLVDSAPRWKCQLNPSEKKVPLPVSRSPSREMLVSVWICKHKIICHGDSSYAPICIENISPFPFFFFLLHICAFDSSRQKWMVLNCY